MCVCMCVCVCGFDIRCGVSFPSIRNITHGGGVLTSQQTDRFCGEAGDENMRKNMYMLAKGDMIANCMSKTKRNASVGGVVTGRCRFLSKEW